VLVLAFFCCGLGLQSFSGLLKKCLWWRRRRDGWFTVLSDAVDTDDVKDIYASRSDGYHRLWDSPQ
jgi:hypothetical protein